MESKTKMKNKIFVMFLAGTLALGSLSVCSAQSMESNTISQENESFEQIRTNSEEQAYIEETLNLANNEEQEWTYDAEADAWTLSIVSAVAYPEIEEEQGVSVCVPGAYISGIDTDKDHEADGSDV